MLGTLRLLAEDRSRGARLVLATAAFDFYADRFAQALGFDEAIATRWLGFDRVPDNCYADAKLATVSERLGVMASAQTRFVSDSFADAPLLDAVDEAIFATSSGARAARATKKGWRSIDPRV